MKEGLNLESGHIVETDLTTKSARLYCRGCSRGCKHYEICDGRPWRTLTPQNTAVSEDLDD
jgi:hypothetical protein